MARGKYAVKSRNRLEVLESQKIQELSTKISGLEAALSDAKQTNNTLRTELNSKAMRVAQGLSSDEKRHLRNQVVSLEHRLKEDRERYALLTGQLLESIRSDFCSSLRDFGIRPEIVEKYENVIGRWPSEKMRWIDVTGMAGAIFNLTSDESLRFFLVGTMGRKNERLIQNLKVLRREIAEKIAEYAPQVNNEWKKLQDNNLPSNFFQKGSLVIVEENTLVIAKENEENSE